MKTSIRVTVHSPTKGTHEEEFNIIQFPSGEIGGHFSPEFVDFTAYAASSINNVIMIVKGYDKDTLFAVALAKEAIDDLIPHDYALKTVIFYYLPNARYDRHMFKGDAAALKVFAKQVNAMGFGAVCAVDPHSYVPDNLFNCFQSIPQKEIAVHYANDPLIDYLVAPDAGAAKKIAETAKEVDKPYITMSKVLGWKTGRCFA